MKRFEGKVVLITGAASGIGRATAHRFAKEGARLVLADIQHERLKELVANLCTKEYIASAVIANVAEQSEVSGLIDDAINRFGQIDVLFNNVGVGRFGHITEVTPDQWRNVMAVNLDSVFYTCRAAIPYLIKTKGCIVNNASISGLFADYGMAAYAASKAAILNLTRNIAIDHAGEGVRANAICPGAIDTPMIAPVLKDEAFMAEYHRLIPLKRIGCADEVAATVAFLASEEASYITGITLPIDGGVTASTGQPNFSLLFRERGWDVILSKK